MTLEDFKREVRDRRGKLTKHDQDLMDIYLGGSEALKDFTLNKKLMGVRNIAWVSAQSDAYQKRFTEWMADKNWKAQKNEIEMWLADNPGVW